MEASSITFMLITCYYVLFWVCFVFFVILLPGVYQCKKNTHQSLGAIFCIIIFVSVNIAFVCLIHLSLNARLPFHFNLFFFQICMFSSCINFFLVMEQCIIQVSDAVLFTNNKYFLDKYIFGAVILYHSFFLKQVTHFRKKF